MCGGTLQPLEPFYDSSLIQCVYSYSRLDILKSYKWFCQTEWSVGMEVNKTTCSQFRIPRGTLPTPTNCLYSPTWSMCYSMYLCMPHGMWPFCIQVAFPLYLCHDLAWWTYPLMYHLISCRWPCVSLFTIHDTISATDKGLDAVV